MERIAADAFPESIGFDWSGVSLQERQANGEEVKILALAVLLVYLVLAFLYESWILPFAVILVVPLGLLGTVAFVSFMGMDNNIYVQIGMVLIIALASKNAILIVEFAKELRRSGESISDATVKAARTRFRPILRNEKVSDGFKLVPQLVIDSSPKSESPSHFGIVRFV